MHGHLCPPPIGKNDKPAPLQEHGPPPYRICHKLQPEAQAPWADISEQIQIDSLSGGALSFGAYTLHPPQSISGRHG